MAIGYACIHIGSEKTKLSTIRLANASEENLRSIIAANLDALKAIVKYNIENDIKLFRISSDIIPLGSHPQNQVKWWEEYQDRLYDIGTLLKDANIRVSMHPGQYTVLNSPYAEVVERAITDLIYHGRFLDALGVDATCKIVLHIGGAYGDKNAAVMRFIQNYRQLDPSIQKRLAIENDDRIYHIEDVLYISQQTGLPVVFDYLHHELHSPQRDLSANEWIEACSKTWGNSHGRQKIHYSQSDPSLIRGAHSKHIHAQEFMQFFKGLRNKDIDLMLEVKDKNLSAVKCILLTRPNVKIQSLEREWARYKYLVLSRSASLYNKIRKLLNDKANPDAMLFYSYIEKALSLKEDLGAQINAAQHVWGYVSKQVGEIDRKKFLLMLDEYRSGKRALKTIKNGIYRMAKQQKVTYLLESLYFYVS
jgi:UV DNA damage endonuclease